MPDLKSELSKVITSWETDVSDTPVTKADTGHLISSNSTRTTFNYIRDNPGVMRDAAVAALSRMGVKTGSSTSLLSTMVARGNIRKTAEGALFAAQAEYKPLAKPVVHAKVAPPVEVVVEPVKTEPVKTDTVQINAAWDADTLLNNLSIKQARALYDELRKIFGG